MLKIHLRFSEFLKNIEADDTLGIAIIDDAKIKQAIENARDKVDVLAVLFHWGNEYQQKPRVDQIARARRVIDWGADMVIGNHPHVVQISEVYKEKPIYYSLGNFVFDQYFSGETQEGLSVGLTLSTGHVKNIYTFPFYSVKSQDFLMTGARRDNFFEWFNDNSRLDGKKFESGKLILDN